MPHGGRQRARGPWDRRGPPHYVAALIAVLVSIALHVVLLRGTPPFRLGRPDLAERTRYRPMQMQETKPLPPPRVEEPARFRPEDPERIEEAFGAPDAALAEQIPLPIPEPPAPAAGPLRADRAPMAGPQDAPPRTKWEPRQDILLVQESLQPQSVSALPRRFVERVNRSVMAPDYTLPATVAEIAASAAGDGSTGLPLRIAGVSVPRAFGQPYRAPVPPPADLRPIAPPSVTESTTNVSPYVASEKYLALDVQTFRPPDEPGMIYFEVRVSRKGEDTLPVLPKDVLILQDCSESITAWKLFEFKAGLRQFIPRLSPGDRLEIVRFSDTQQACFGGWTPFTSIAQARALAFVEDMRSQGQTDVFGSLEASTRLPRDPARPLVTLLITDARPTVGVTDSSSIIEQFTRTNAGNRPIFAFGAGRRVNRFLADFLTYRNRGDARLLTETNNIPLELDQWAAGLERPVLSDLRCQFVGIPDTDVFPGSLTDLFLDRPLVLHGRCAAERPKTAFQVVGNSGQRRHDFVFAMDLQQARPGDAQVRTRWVWHQLYEWIGAYTAKPDPSLLARIRGLAARHRLDVPYLEAMSSSGVAP